jgi:hypothetical protein
MSLPVPGSPGPWPHPYERGGTPFLAAPVQPTVGAAAGPVIGRTGEHRPGPPKGGRTSTQFVTDWGRTGAKRSDTIG